MKKQPLGSSLKLLFIEIRKELNLNYHVKDFERDLNQFADNNKPPFELKKQTTSSHFETVVKQIRSDKFKKLVLDNWLYNFIEIKHGNQLTPKQRFNNFTSMNFPPSGMFDHRPIDR